MATVSNVQLVLVSGTDRQMRVEWNWNKSNTDHYVVKWYWANGQGWNVGSTDEVTAKQAFYTAPTEAKKVKVKIKPVYKSTNKNAKTVTVNWGWSTEKQYNFANNPPTKPPTPTIEYLSNGEYVKISIDNYDDSTTHDAQFEIMKDNTKRVGSLRYSQVNTGHAEITVKASELIPGHTYKARVRGLKDVTWVGTAGVIWSGVVTQQETTTIASVGDYGEWSDYSTELLSKPKAVTSLKTIKALSETSVYIDWVNTSTADSYEIEYTTDKRYFDSSPNNVSSLTVSVGHAEITGLDTGNQWFFRIRSVNTTGNSDWSDVYSITLGKKPAAPSTWSTSSVVNQGDDIILNWTHNSEDGSDMTKAKVMLKLDNSDYIWYLIINKQSSESNNVVPMPGQNGSMMLIAYINMNNQESSTFNLYNDMGEGHSVMIKDNVGEIRLKTDDASYSNGAIFNWSVMTQGVLDEYGDESVRRTIKVYSPITLQMSVEGVISDDVNVTMTSYPLNIDLEVTESDIQKPVSYFVSVISNQSYEWYDNTGNNITISAGETIYQHYYDTSETQMNIELTPADLTLANNNSYTINVTVAMDSGLTADSNMTMLIAFEDEVLEPNAYIYIDKDTLTANIIPFCQNNSDLETENDNGNNNGNKVFTELMDTGVPDAIVHGYNDIVIPYDDYVYYVSFSDRGIYKFEDGVWNKVGGSEYLTYTDTDDDDWTVDIRTYRSGVFNNYVYVLDDTPYYIYRKNISDLDDLSVAWERFRFNSPTNEFDRYGASCHGYLMEYDNSLHCFANCLRAKDWGDPRYDIYNDERVAHYVLSTDEYGRYTFTRIATIPIDISNRQERQFYLTGGLSAVVYDNAIHLINQIHHFIYTTSSGWVELNPVPHMDFYADDVAVVYDNNLYVFGSDADYSNYLMKWNSSDDTWDVIYKSNNAEYDFTDYYYIFFVNNSLLNICSGFENNYIDKHGHYVYQYREPSGSSEEHNPESDQTTLLSVYRRDFDGRFTEIASNLPNTGQTMITDPHPALDYARYRIVAKSGDTGAIYYTDVPGVEIGEKAIIINWNDYVTYLDVEDDTERAELPWYGNMLKLPYNVDVADNNNIDTNMNEYIGREHPVSYYGTHTGETATWNVDIDKRDTQTLYMLRLLRIYKGDVYVREPSGSGYWAHIVISFNQKHTVPIIPVTISITRVEGGM